MVRVGGGWDTLEHYLDKHDPCRCRSSHRAAMSSKVVQKNPVPYELNNASVYYERSPPRTRRSSASSSSSGHGGREHFRDDLLTTVAQPQPRNRSRSPTPRLQPPRYVATYNLGSPRHRSASPNPIEKATSRRSKSRSGYDAPTAASRNRSRSPSVRNPSDIIPPMDSSSEVSDEGYRSLGRIINARAPGTPAKTIIQDNHFTNFDDRKCSLRDGSFSGSCSEINDSRRNSREPSVDSNCRSSPERRRRSSIGTDISRMTRSHSVSSGDTAMDSSPLRRSSATSVDKPFQRGSPIRGSLPANRRRNNQVSPLVSDLIQVQSLEDDKLILEKMKELISQYSGILDSPDDRCSSWSGDDDKSPHRRKDSKYEGPISKIPAPVFYKQPSSEKEF